MIHNHKHISEQDFVSLISTNQRRILAYIIVLVPNRSDAEDLMQETIALMWEKRDDFAFGTDFVSWGIRIAHYKILNYRKKVANKYKFVIDDEQFKRYERLAVEKSRCAEEMIYKLDECIKKISKKDRQLIHMRYSKEISVKEISSHINKSVRSVYLNLSRIHGLLLRCIQGNQA